jgi:hypothetical protein
MGGAKMLSEETEQREKKPQREIITAPLYFDRYVTSELRALEQNIVSLRDRVDERFADLERSIDERFTQVDRRFADLRKSIDERFARVNRRIDERIASFK